MGKKTPETEYKLRKPGDFQSSISISFNNKKFDVIKITKHLDMGEYKKHLVKIRYEKK